MNKNKFKHFGFIAAFGLASLIPISAFMPNNNIDSPENTFNKSMVQNEMKTWLKDNRQFLNTLFPNVTKGVNIFAQNESDLYSSVLRKFYHCSPTDIDSRECMDINGYSSYFTSRNHEFSSSNNIIIGVKVIDQDYGSISDFLKDKHKLLDIIFFHEFGHYLLNHYPDEANDFIAQNNLSYDDAMMLNESFADTFSIAMMHYKYPQLDVNELKTSVIKYRLDGLEINPEHKTFVAVINFEIPEEKDLHKLLKVCLESSKQTFNYTHKPTSIQILSIRDKLQKLTNKNPKINTN